MAAVSLFWNTNMAAVTSCENALFSTTLTRTIIAPSYGMTPGLKSSTTIRIFALEVQNNNAGCNLGFAHT